MSFYNKEEMKNFVTKCDFVKQRVGFLVGWYAEDKNYKNGVRCIIEGIYEPPQEGSVEGFVLLKDSFFKSV
jgi:nuclear protein localization family protein 4